MRSLYCTADLIGTPSGGGAVTANELEALGAISDEVVALSAAQINPGLFGQPDSPFASDYFALLSIQGQRFDLAHLYSGTFSATVRYLKEKGTKVSYCVPAHDRRTTVEEFERLGLEYPWAHIKVDSLWRIFSQGYREADVVIAPSIASARFLEAEGCENVDVIHHGCNLPERVAPLPAAFTAGYLGQAGPDKGLVYLIGAWETLNYPDNILVLAGPGTEGLAPFIQQKVGGGQFKLAGFVQDKSAFFNSISVFIQPSVVESFGICVLEAMAHQRPVVVSEGAGVSELVGDAGFVVPIRDRKAIAEKIDWLKRHPAQAAEMGRRGRKIAEKYTWQKIQKQYQGLWKNIQ